MRAILTAGVVALVLSSAAAAADPAMPAPGKEHEWLKQLAGEWTTDASAVMAPDQPPVSWKGTDSTKPLGGFWAMTEMKGDPFGAQMTGVMTLGYDAGKKKYVGTFVCSMGDTLFNYEGTLDAAGKVLTLNTEGPDMTTGKTVKMRDVIELKDKDTKVLTSYTQGVDGKWTKFMTMTATRKK